MDANLKTRNSAAGINATCVRLNAKAADAAAIAPVIETRPLTCRADDVVVEIQAAGVNPSDVKAATGLMPYAVFPRTPGRDYAGLVVDGPREWLGKAVFGTSGDLGIRRDGTHASHLVVEAAALVEKPPGISMDEAAGIGVPFVTAIEGFRRAGMPKPGDFDLEHVQPADVLGDIVDPQSAQHPSGFAVVALDLARLGGGRLAHFTDELDQALVEADYRPGRALRRRDRARPPCAT
jgi:hypothetical protein